MPVYKALIALTEQMDQALSYISYQTLGLTADKNPAKPWVDFLPGFSFECERCRRLFGTLQPVPNSTQGEA